jgi:4-amino-4-deoxy-L-arabinose transferase-like glycosyltransferase
MLNSFFDKIKNFFLGLTARDYCVMLIMLAGILARGVMLGSIPGGVKEDEAFAGYEAYSLLHYGIDSSGYAFPVYFNSWGSGMNALNSYLMIPFIALFGLHTWVIRIPQFLVSCFSMYVFYKLMKHMFNEQLSLLALLYFAICPWSIIMARWGLESNLASGFLLFGFYFFVLGAEKSKYFLLSALFYGLSLYCYATIWPIMPFIIALQILYLLWTKKISFDRYSVLSILLLAFLALPLLIFYRINTGHMDEIRTAFFSIPKLTVMREKDISIWDKRHNLSTMLNLLFTQSDGLYWNAAPKYGLYYKWALPFAVIGLIHCIVKTFISIIKRKFIPEALLIFQFLCALVLGCLIEMNVNRINSIHIPVISFIVIGMYVIISFAAKYIKYARELAAVALSVCFVCFMIFYFTEYRAHISSDFQEGIGESVERAIELSDGSEPIHIDAYINYAKILYYGKIPADEYRDTVVYTNYPSAYLALSSCGNYVFELPDTSKDCIYVLTEKSIDDFVKAGWTVEQYAHSAVAYNE